MKKKLINSQLTNYKTYLMYKRQFKSLAQNVFLLKNLPNYMDSRYINRILLEHGSIAFFYDEILDELVALPFTNNSVLDVYGRPRRITVRGENGYTRILTSKEFVIMYDNSDNESIMKDVVQYAERVANCERVSDVNMSQQKTPRLWSAPSEMVKTVSDMLNEVEGNIENVVAYDNVNIDEINCILDPAPYVVDKIDIHKEKIISEFYSRIGVSSVTEQKKERVIKSEMISSLGGTIAHRYSRFEPRKEAVDFINEKWGDKLENKIIVEYYDGLPTNMTSENNKKEDEVDINDV